MYHVSPTIQVSNATSAQMSANKDNYVLFFHSIRILRHLKNKLMEALFVQVLVELFTS